LNTFDQFIAVIQILKTLASCKEIELLHKQPVYNTSDKKQQPLNFKFPRHRLK